MRTVVDEGRRPWRREHAAAELPELSGRADLADDRLDLLAALARLPARQRAAVVLRYWADLDIAETARVLGVTEGTVKSSSSKGLAALALVVAVPAVALRSGQTGGTGTPAGDVPAPTPTGSPAPSTLRVPGPVPGVTDAQARAIARGCGQSYGGDIGHVNPTPEPGQTQGPLVRDAVRLFNVVRDEAGLHALLYGPGTQLSCDVDGGRYSAGGMSGDPGGFPGWLPGAVSVDSVAGTEAAAVVEGRVTGAVTSVVVVLSGRSLRVTPVNGTYIARFRNAAAPSEPPGVTAYGRAGLVIGRAGAETGCFTDPAGRVVVHGRGGDDTGCRPASPWR